ncbi:hypothetical protein AD998_19080 [bacterium 336/3]|nr:hypothetical protein AD998_19080 [bacterium 336/3]
MKMHRKKIQILTTTLLFVFLFVFSNTLYAQQDSTTHKDTLNKKRLFWVVGTSTVLYSGTLVGLNELWYKNSPRTSFHFFNDNAQWRQIDKIGHAYSAYHVSRLSTELFRWSGLKPKNAVLWGAITSQLMMTPIEIFDGFSAEYGASWGDVVANFSGGLLWWGQHQIWNEPHIHFKYSFQQSPYAQFRPNVLGKNLREQLLKDYNGQTYWLSVDLHHFLRKEKFPRWLNLAVGTGANRMVFAREPENNLNGYSSYRQYYLSFDIHLPNIRTRSKFLKKVFWTLGTIRLPAPALEFNKIDKVKWHWLYF